MILMSDPVIRELCIAMSSDTMQCARHPQTPVIFHWNQNQLFASDMVIIIKLI